MAPNKKEREAAIAELIANHGFTRESAEALLGEIGDVVEIGPDGKPVSEMRRRGPSTDSIG